MSDVEDSKKGRTTRSSSRRSEIEVVHVTLGKKSAPSPKNGQKVSEKKAENGNNTTRKKPSLSLADKREVVKNETSKRRATMKKELVKSTTKEKDGVENERENGDSKSSKKTTPSPAIVKESVLDETKNGECTSSKVAAVSASDVKEAVQNKRKKDVCIVDKEIILIPSVKKEIKEETNNGGCTPSEETDVTPDVKKEEVEEDDDDDCILLPDDETEAVENETKLGRGLRKKSPGYLKRKLEFFDKFEDSRPAHQKLQKNTTSGRKSMKGIGVKVESKYRGGKLSSGAVCKNATTTHTNKNNMALSLKEEKEICQLLRKCSEKGVPLTIMEIRVMVRQYLKKQGRVVPFFSGNLPGIDWYRGFRKRHSKEFDDILTVAPPASFLGSSSKENDSEKKTRNTSKPQPPPRYALTPSEEKDVVEMLIKRVERGRYLSSMSVRIMVRDYLNKLGRKNSVFTNNMPGKKWFESFKRRHSNVFKQNPSTKTTAKSEFSSISKETIMIEEEFGNEIGQAALSPAEEDDIVKILKKRAESGISLHYLEVRKVVRDYLNKLGRKKSVFTNNMPGVNWYAAFKKRHLDVFNILSGKRSSRLQYTETDVASAFEDVTKGESVNAAANKHGVPRVTLQRVSQQSGMKKKVQPTALTFEEEKEIAQQIVKRAENGICAKYVTVRAFVRDYLNKRGRTVPQFTNNRPGKKWYTKFRQRHQEMLTKSVFGGTSNKGHGGKNTRSALRDSKKERSFKAALKADKTTLQKSKKKRKIIGRIGQTALAPEEEDEIVRQLLKHAKKVKSMTSLDIRKFVRDYLNERGQIVPVFKNNMPGNDWFMAFRKRHEEVSNLSFRQEKSIPDSSVKHSDSSSIEDENDIEHEEEVTPEISSGEDEGSNTHIEANIQITLTPEEEKDIVQQISECTKWGMQLTPLHVRIIVRDFLDKCGRVVLQFPNNMPPVNWYESFVNRHQELKDILAKSTCEEKKNDDSLMEVDEPLPTATPQDQKCIGEDATDASPTNSDEKEPIIIKIA